MFRSTQSTRSRDDLLERAKREREARSDDKKKHASATVIQVVIIFLSFTLFIFWCTCRSVWGTGMVERLNWWSWGDITLTRVSDSIISDSFYCTF